MLVIKRDGTIMSFSIERIHKVLLKLPLTDKTIEMVLITVIESLEREKSITVEFIQDKIEHALMFHGLFDIAKNFILYRNNHHKKRIPNCKKPSESFVPEYPFCDEVADKQAIDWEWHHLENDPSEDINGLLSYATKSEMNAVTYASKILTHYEGILGESYWAARFQHIFPRHEFRNVGLVFARMETQTHAKVYRKFNEVLNLEVDGFYESYVNESALKNRMDFISQSLKSDEDLISLATFTLLEGVSLFQIFAFFKHFQNGSKNLLPKFVANINFSARDENLHANFSASCFKILRDESFLSEIDKTELNDKILAISNQLRDHEYDIIDGMLPNNDIVGFDKYDAKLFVDSRINIILETLGIYPMIINDPISKWFYNGIDRFIYNDNFAKGGREYTRRFSPEDFEI